MKGAIVGKVVEGSDSSVVSDTQLASSSSLAESDTVAAVPKSLSEIYEISNRNRKRNKERKKQKDGQLSATSSIDESEFAKVRDQLFSSIDSKASTDAPTVHRGSSENFDASSYFKGVPVDMTSGNLSTEGTVRS